MPQVDEISTATTVAVTDVAPLIAQNHGVSDALLREPIRIASGKGIPRKKPQGRRNSSAAAIRTGVAEPSNNLTATGVIEPTTTRTRRSELRQLVMNRDEWARSRPAAKLPAPDDTSRPNKTT